MLPLSTPYVPAAAATSSWAILGEAHNTSLQASHTFDSATANGGNPLPTNLPVGTYDIIVMGGAAPSSVSIPGATVGAVGYNVVNGLQNIHQYQVTVASPITSLSIVIGFGSSVSCGVCIVDRGGLSLVNGIAFNRQSGTTTFPLNNNGTTSIPTTAGDKVAAFVNTTDTTPGAYTGITQFKPFVSMPGPRLIGIARNTNALGGSPETMTLTTSVAFKACSSMFLVYR